MEFKTGVHLADRTTFKLGGEARYFAEARTATELHEAARFAREKKIPLLVLGGGSNVLIADKGFSGLVLTPLFPDIEFTALDALRTQVVAGASVSWDSLVSAAVARGLHGIENLSGIPGTVGAAPVQNIGAYGTEVRETIAWVDAVDSESGEVVRLTNAECAFAYRDSLFKRPEGKRFVITAVAFTLERSAPANIGYKDLAEYFSRSDNEFPTLPEIREAVLSIRARKFPDLTVMGTAGSFFKNPIVSEEVAAQLRTRMPGLPMFPGSAGVKISLAWILDTVLGVRGECVGDACVWDAQPLVLVNKGHAQAADVAHLAKNIRARVADATGIMIEPEVSWIEIDF